MRRRSAPQIEERLISDTLSEYMDRVDTGRDLWPEIRVRLSQPRRARVPVLVKLVVAAAVLVALTAMLSIAQPWSPAQDSMTAFAAVNHAYERLFELETVRYRVDGTNSGGQEFVELHQVDMVNRIEYWVLQIVTGPPPGAGGGAPRQEFIRIDGFHYINRPPTAAEPLASEQPSSESSPGGWSLFPDPIGHPEEGHPWAPFGQLGGIPWSSEGAEEAFDKVDLVGNAEVDGQPVIHYRASRRSGLKDVSNLRPMVLTMDGKRVEAVHRGVEDHLKTIDTVDFWVTPDGGMLIEVDWTHTERGPELPDDYRERDWCQGLGEFSEPEYGFRLWDDEENVPGVVVGDPTMSLNTHELGQVICWNEDETEGRMPWGRNLPEIAGEDFWVRWVYTFTAFNEPLDLPKDLPE